MSATWARFVNTHSPEAVEFLGTFPVHFISYWALSLFFLALDILSSSDFLARYKLQSPSKLPSRPVLWRASKVVVGNQLFTGALHFTYLYILRPLLGLPRIYRISSALPSIKEIALCIFWSTLGREVIFYYGHRILHHPWVYARIHKQHHQFTAPVALAVAYCHPVEHIMCNVLPISVPPVLFGAHIVTFWIFVVGAILQAQIAHSGYDCLSVFGWTPKEHDVHHELFSVNYGLLGLMDHFHGTRYEEKSKKAE